MKVGGNAPEEESTLFCSVGQSSSTANSPRNQGRQVTQSTRSCCQIFRDWIHMGFTISQNDQPTSKLKFQVAKLAKEVQRKEELLAMYNIRLARLQDYLRYCLQMAKDNGFLEYIIHNKDKDNQRLISIDIVNIDAIPQMPTLPPSDYDLPALIDRAKLNGWYIEPHEIELHEKVARGSTADVHRGIWRGLDVAVKCIDSEFFHSNGSGLSFFAQEVETLSKQRHRFVLNLMGACLEPPDHGWIVTEFLSTTLKEWLHGPGKRQRERSVPLPPFKERLAKALELAQAMQYLHEQKPMVVHRDLKPSNIFLDDAMHVKVADFGHARFLSNGEKALTGETGTYVYMAPEVMMCKPYNEKCDVYSFGIILNELITGDHPYIETDHSPIKIATEVVESNLRPALPEDDGRLEELIELIRLSWDEDDSIRPSFATITTKLKRVQERFTDSV